MSNVLHIADGRIAGYRIVRKLGAGSRADVFLGAGSTGTAVLKVFHDEVVEESVGNELDALGRLDSPHFVRLLDISSAAGDLPILILERVQRGSVATLLRDRDSLERGEVVTLLAPLAATLPELHRLGVGHQGIGATSVHIGSAGEPVLLGFGHCELFGRDGSIAAIDAEPAAARDRDALATLVVMLLEQVRDAAVDRRVTELIEWVDAAPREYEFPERLVSRLFDFADPLPIELGRDSSTSAVPARIDLPDAASRIERVGRTEPVAQSVELVESRAVQPGGVLERLGAFANQNPIELLKSRVVDAARGVRKPFWFVVGGVALAFVIVIAVLPQSPARPAAGETPKTTPTAAAPAPTTPALPDDPVLALPILLRARTQCIRDLSVLCLDGVDEASSSAYNDDAALIEQLQGGSEIPSTAIITASAPTLTETLGDSALLGLGANSDPASVLMIKDEAGWRIRGYLSGIPATGSPTAGGGTATG